MTTYDFSTLDEQRERQRAAAITALRGAQDALLELAMLRLHQPPARDFEGATACVRSANVLERIITNLESRIPLPSSWMRDASE